MVRRVARVGPAVAFLLLAAGPAWAAKKTDVVVLKNADRLTGEVVQMRQGKLQVKTDDAGTLSIEWDKVAAITTAAAYDVSMRDGRRLLGRFSAGAAGSLQLTDSSGAAIALPMGDIVWFATIKSGFLDRIDGSVDVGGSYTKSSGVAEASFAASAQYRRPADIYAVAFDANLTQQEDEPLTSRYTLKTTVTHFTSGVWFVAPLGFFESNRELGFTFRGTGAFSVGRYLVRSKRTELVAAGGISAGRETPVDEPSFTNVDAMSTVDFSLFTYDFPTTRVDFALLVFPSLNDAGRVRLNATTKIRREIFHDFYFSVSAFEAFDSKPQGAGRQNDFGASLSFGWTF
jgi:ethanolamine utilization microcompartment shell protein EutS